MSTHDDMYMYSRAAVRLFVYNYVYGHLLFLIYSLCKQTYIFDVIVSTHDDMYMYSKAAVRLFVYNYMSTDIFCFSSIHYVNKYIFLM